MIFESLSVYLTFCFSMLISGADGSIFMRRSLYDTESKSGILYWLLYERSGTRTPGGAGSSPARFKFLYVF